MKVYAETNFVLEMALQQEQYCDCEAIVRLCKERRINLIIPAYSLVEPYETLIRRHRERKKLKLVLETELNQLGRTDSYIAKSLEVKSLMKFLIKSTEEEMKLLKELRNDLLRVAETVPLNSEILKSSAEHQNEHDLSPQDAIVYASVLSHLKRTEPQTACFLNKNSKDFDDPDISEMLERYQCQMLSRFDHGYQFIINKIR